MDARRIKHRSKHNAATFIVFPLLFIFITFLLIYFTVMPAAGPYLGLAGLFFNNPPQASAPRNLLAAATPPPVHDNTQAGTGLEGPGETPALIPVSSITMPRPGDLYGRLTVEGTVIDAPVYWDDSAKELNAGIGTYTGGWLPGFGRTIMMAGHRDSWLRDLKSAEIGAIVTVQTHYGLYEYEITDIAVFRMDDSSSYDFTRTDENLILYTCYPFDFIGAAKERYFVYGRLVSGLQVDRSS